MRFNSQFHRLYTVFKIENIQVFAHCEFGVGIGMHFIYKLRCSEKQSNERKHGDQYKQIKIPNRFACPKKPAEKKSYTQLIRKWLNASIRLWSVTEGSDFVHKIPHEV